VLYGLAASFVTTDFTPSGIAESRVDVPSGIGVGRSGRQGELEAGQRIMLPMAISYLDRLLEPLTDVLTPEVAAALLELRADTQLQAHIEELRRKANEGTLTRAEDAEYKDFVEAVDVISIIQAKARRFLEKQSA
jgi:hypothetical protein